MGIRIHQLPVAISNQIAAGEVIERPASVVKELLENSYDAGADSIHIEIGYGGLNQIKISDNGSGIFSEDLPLAVAAHATSKITKLDDLYAIDSMGFRGEALASIASVAKVTISSKPASQKHAMMLQMKGTEFNITSCARNQGTTIDVSDLFFNAPVRKRFLKSEQLEFQAIEIVVKRFALSAPHITLSLKHNNKQVLLLPAALNEKTKMVRMTKIFGAAFVKDAIFLDVERSDMRLMGWISGPTFQRSQNDKQWIYINNRMVRDKLIHHAIKKAYEDLLHPGRFPACLLYFTINTAEVDVNVHPTKHEVRFQQPRLIHDFISSQITEALKTKYTENDDSVSADKFSDKILNTKISEPSSDASYYHLPLHITSKSNKAEVSSSPWIILNNQYVIIFIQNNPYVVDVILLQQHWLLTQLKNLELPWASRPVLVPMSLFTSTDLKNRLEELEPFLNQLGIHFEWTVDRIFIQRLPICLPYLDVKRLMNLITELEFESFCSEKLISLMCQSQMFDVQLLNNDERLELNQFLFSQITEMDKQTYFKSLTIDECRKLVHE